ncbi:MAG: hypothetical protein ACYDHM_06270 [Acidiferrobacterales bacterium]
MNIRKLEDGRIVLDLEKAELDPLARPVIAHAEDMHSALLDFADILRSAAYGMRDQFRQPPRPWDAGARHPGMDK